MYVCMYECLYIHTYIYYLRDNHMGKLTGQVHIHMCLCFMPLKQLIVQGHFTSIDARSLGVCQDYHHVHHVCYLVYGYGLLVYCLGSTTSATCVTPNKAARQSSKRSGLRAEGLGFRVHSMRALSLSLSLSHFVSPSLTLVQCPLCFAHLRDH